MSVFTIGDPHLSLSSEKPMDIFKGWGNYTERLEQNWRNIVSDSDTVVLAGDISWAMTLDEARADFAFLDSLPGNKIILKGNHDYWWTTMRKMENWASECGFSSIKFLFNNSYIVDGFGICGTRGWMFSEADSENDKILARETGRLRASIESLDFAACNDVAAFLHYPPIYRGNVLDSIVELLKQNGIKKCYYGHLHGMSIGYAFGGEHDGIEFKLISADHLKFAPYKVAE